MISSSLILFPIIFVSLFFIFLGIEKLSNKKYKKSIIYFVLGLGILLLMFLILIFLKSNICLDAITPAQFRTNILTGKCVFFPGSSCVENFPWYSKEGCNIDMEKKTNILKNIKWYGDTISWYDKVTANCTEYCEQFNEKFFCNKENNLKSLCEELAESNS